jgi:hypothetical protein
MDENRVGDIKDYHLTTLIYSISHMFFEPGYQELLIMIGRMKILALILALVINGSAATLALNRDQESDAGCREAPKTI